MSDLRFFVTEEQPLIALALVATGLNVARLEVAEYDPRKLASLVRQRVLRVVESLLNEDKITAAIEHLRDAWPEPESGLSHPTLDEMRKRGLLPRGDDAICAEMVEAIVMKIHELDDLALREGPRISRLSLHEIRVAVAAALTQGR